MAVIERDPWYYAAVPSPLEPAAADVAVLAALRLLRCAGLLLLLGLRGEPDRRLRTAGPAGRGGYPGWLP